MLPALLQREPYLELSPLWLQAQRRQAWEAFKASNLPNQRDEAWKYLNLTGFYKHAFHPAEPDQAKDLTLPDLLPASNSQRLVFIDGHFSAALSLLQPLAAGVVLAPLSSVFQENHPAIQAYFNASQAKPDIAFINLNTAMCEEGIYLSIPAEVEVKEPIQILYLATQQGFAQHPRNLISLGEGAKACIIETYVSLTEQPYFTNVVTEIYTAAGAHLSHVKLQAESSKAFHISHQTARLAQDSVLQSLSLTLGSQLSRQALHIMLQGAGANCDLQGFTLASKQQQLQHSIHIDHQQPAGKSRQCFKTIADDKARAIFDGKVTVQPGAQKTDASQSNQNLLLARDAEIDTKPQLEIYADDVKCSHGATVGQLQEEALFYLQARGIPEQQARNLLLQAFAKDILQGIEDSAIQAYCQGWLSKYLPAAGDL